ncbi:Dendritic cell-specific transmembrane protein-like domain-containing protein [Strongyloides ratti]|uniref:Dendritic cell-specific transmembrane protein-like domain-containing protein n=1 Tax=Strongyloides ratti TaxID=34506 RepID=A0A090L500_STRRB|nr:Dendritic cell-specific transmembrane protein-like domain-containing protein [Strongyloides ratti]CEF64876.1 Dendritic cell-specific transmembrane protein-like domain-containing protein [Strongyloides ratti]
MKILSFLVSIFINKRREKLRKKRGISWLADLLIYSSSYDYRLLRFITTLPFNFIFSNLLYTVAWGDLNYMEYSPQFAWIFQAFITFLLMLFFAYSPTFRSILIVAVVTTIGRSGLTIVTWKIMDNLINGPVTNMAENFKQTATGITCFVALQKNVTEERFTLAAGPLEHFIQSNIAKGIKISKKIINTIKVILQPFKDEVEEKTEEDELAESLKKYKTSIEERELLKNNIKDIVDVQKTNISDTVVKYSKFRSNLVKKMATRMEDRCMEIFRQITTSCVSYLDIAKEACYTKIPNFIGQHICPNFNQEKYCSGISEKETKNKCDNLISNNSDTLFPVTFDQEIQNFKDSSTHITEEMAISMHMKRIDGERKTNVKLMGQLSNMIHSEIHYIQIAIESMKEFGNLWVLMFVYIIFEDSVIFCRNFLNEIEFENYYYTWYFWKIDNERQKSKKTYLYPLTNAEKKINKIINVFGKPIPKEKKAMKLPFILWIVLTFFVIGVISLDHYFYRVLNVVNKYGNIIYDNSGSSKISLNITGEGIFVDWMREMLSFNYTRISNNTITSNFCNKSPIKPKYMNYFQSLALPLLYMLFCQVIFNYLIKRITVVYILGYMFRKRQKTRVIYLYNKILYSRENIRKMTRTKIRFEAKKEILYHQDSALMWIFRKGYIKNYIIDRFFKLYKCLLCEERYQYIKIITCNAINCPGVYCYKCWKDNNNLCYACLAKTDKVNSEKTRIIEKEDVYLEKYKKIKDSIRESKKLEKEEKDNKK